MGPHNVEKFGVSRVDKIRHATSLVTKAYFDRPAHYLFYGLLTITTLGLFTGMSFSREYYWALVVTAVLKFGSNIHSEWLKTKKEDK